MNNKVILIGGMPRSGTTLISNFIQREMSIPIAPETHFFDIASVNDCFVDISGLPRPVLNDKILGPIYKELDGVLIEDCLEVFEKILRKIFDDKLEIVGEKTPAHLVFFDRIAENRDNYFFIIMQRSCLEVCNSLKYVPWNKKSMYKNALRWSKYYKIAFLLLKKYPERFLIVNYNDLCENPFKELYKIKEKFNFDCFNQNISEFINYDDNLEPWKKKSNLTPYKKNKTKINILVKIIFTVYEKLYVSYIRCMYK